MKPSIVLFSDFGLDSGYVSCMHGVCKQVDPALDLNDGTHMLPAFDARAASYTLQYTVPAWPNGTVFVCVVDPGVGTSRRAAVAKLANGSYVVTPDNGTLTFLKEQIGVVAVREIDETINRYRGSENVSVFHGRDLFSYTAARLASGVITYEQVGPEYPVAEIVTHPVYPTKVGEGWISGAVESADPFGTLETSIRNTEIGPAGFNVGDTVHVTLRRGGSAIFEDDVLFGATFGDVAVGDPIMFHDLANYVSIGLNEANMAEKLGFVPGEVLDVVISAL